MISDFAASFGDLVIDGPAWEARLRGELIDLTKTEFEILIALASRARRVVTDDELTRAVWGDNWFGDEGNLAVHVSKLRRKLGEDGTRPHYIRTVRGVGYRFDPGPDGLPSHAGRSYEALRARPGAVEVRTDGLLRVVAVSPDGAPVLGFEPREVLGRYFPVIGDSPWADHDSALDGVRALITSGVREWVACHVVRRADGSLVEADFATRLEVDSDGALRELRFVLVELRGGGAALNSGHRAPSRLP